MQVITQTKELLQNANEQCRNQEKAVEEKQKQINKFQSTMEEMSSEIIKVLTVHNVLRCQV